MMPPHVGVSPSEPHAAAALVGRNTHPAVGHPPATPGAMIPPHAGVSAAAAASKPVSPVTFPQWAAVVTVFTVAAATQLQPLGHKCSRVKPEQAVGNVPVPPGVQVLAAVLASQVQPFGQVPAVVKPPQWLAVGVPTHRAGALGPQVQPFGQVGRVV